MITLRRAELVGDLMSHVTSTKLDPPVLLTDAIEDHRVKCKVVPNRLELENR